MHVGKITDYIIMYNSIQRLGENWRSISLFFLLNKATVNNERLIFNDNVMDGN